MQITPSPAIVSPSTLFRAASDRLSHAGMHVQAAMTVDVPDAGMASAAIADAQAACRLVRSAITPQSSPFTARAAESALQHAATGISLLQHYARLASEGPTTFAAGLEGGEAEWIQHLLGAALTEFTAAQSSLWIG